ncbi:MAG: PQQ-dependent sugar dehydrogenase, partial [Synechococcaceae cyanobacterium RM1_1_27]|nr:PQQ-dependent sugar dehydrogenase [Synechococcaceae cyanobacterium RM1_1_27]
GSMFVTLGDRYSLKDQAQDPSNHIGKVVRIRPDGSPAPGNPASAGWAKEVWSVGHRNIQGLATHPDTGEVWAHEHGPRGGDEINRIAPSLNYGWPLITYGREYSGSQVGQGISAQAGLEQPVVHWTPSVAPSGMTFYTGDAFPDWRGDLFVGALAGQHLARLQMEGERVIGHERLLDQQVGRIRDVRTGPDGFLYLLTDDPNGSLLRLEPL